MFSYIMEGTSLWLLSLKKAAETRYGIRILHNTTTHNTTQQRPLAGYESYEGKEDITSGS